MPNNKVIEFPPKEFIVRCKPCGSNKFYVILGEANPHTIKHLECVGCGSVFSPTDSEISYPGSEKNEEKN